MGRMRHGVGALALLGGCGPFVIAYPPTASLPTDLDAVDPGQVEVGAGLSGFPDGQAFLAPNPLGGGVLGSVGVGLSERTDLSVTASKHWQGPTASLRLGYDLYTDLRWEIGAVGGTGASLASGTYNDEVVVSDANGDPVLDDEGAWVIEKESVDYAYGSIAPHLGLRAVYHGPSGVYVPFLVRSAYSMTYARRGLDREMPRSFWQELGIGIGYEYDGIELGVAATGVLWVNEGEVMPWAHLGASMSGSVDLRRR